MRALPWMPGGQRALRGAWVEILVGLISCKVSLTGGGKTDVYGGGENRCLHLAS